MTDTNSTALRNALAAAVKKHADDNGLSAKQAAEAADVQLSRMYLVLRGDVTKVSSDALVNILGGFGYRLSVEDGAIVLSQGGADNVLPEITKPESIESHPVEVPGGVHADFPAGNHEQFDPDFDRVSTDE